MGCCCVRVRKRGHLVCMYVVRELGRSEKKKKNKNKMTGREN